MRNKRVRFITTSAMFIALVIATTFINVPFPGAAGGLVHLGTMTMLIIAMRFGKKYGLIAGGIGMTIFDIYGGWMAWAPGTFIVRSAMGYVVGWIAYNSQTDEQGLDLVRNLLAWLSGLIIMIVGYYLYEAIFLTDFRVALLSIWGNVIQFIIGIVAPLFVTYGLRSKQIDEFMTN